MSALSEFDNFREAEAGEFTRTVVIEWDSLDTAQNAYDGDAYQKALEALDGGAIREFRYLEAMS